MFSFAFALCVWRRDKGRVSERGKEVRERGIRGKRKAQRGGLVRETGGRWGESSHVA